MIVLMDGTMKDTFPCSLHWRPTETKTSFTPAQTIETAHAAVTIQLVWIKTNSCTPVGVKHGITWAGLSRDTIKFSLHKLIGLLDFQYITDTCWVNICDQFNSTHMFLKGVWRIPVSIIVQLGLGMTWIQYVFLVSCCGYIVVLRGQACTGF